MITGATGFVGSRFIELVAQRHEIVATARRAPAPTGPQVDWVRLDLDNDIAAQSLPEPLDAVAHLAVSRRHRDFPESGMEQFRVNLASTAALLDHALKAGAKSFVLMSTGSVYDAASGQPLREQDRVSPSDYFAATKAASEMLLRPYAEHMAVCSLRLFFPYGAGQVARLIPEIVNRVREGRPVTLGGGGDGMKLTPIFIDDVVGILEQSVSEAWQGTYNVAGPEVLSLREIAEAIGEVLGKPPVFERAPGPTVTFEPDLTRLASRVDLAGLRTFQEGIRATLATS